RAVLAQAVLAAPFWNGPADMETGGAPLGEVAEGSGPEEIRAVLAAWCKRVNLEVSPPFLVGWYNHARTETAGGSQMIEAPDNAVAFTLHSVPGYLDVVVEHFARARPSRSFVDATTDEILAWIRERLPAELCPHVVNTDVGPPYYHVQTMGAVAGVDQHIEPDEFQDPEDVEWKEDLSDRLADTRDPKMWGTDPATRRKIFAVNVHPDWGGWYAYRALVVLRGLEAAGLERPAPKSFVPPAEGRRMLTEYNLRHQECLWRDLTAEGHLAERRYSPEEYFFFMETSGEKRRRFLELSAARLPTSLEPRLPQLGAPTGTPAGAVTEG
ncbi:unnamed protein product, partial [Prorocentrum cordatum]